MITRFKGDYFFLSNFYEAPVIMDSVRYPTVEHAYQAAKTRDKQWRELIRHQDTPGRAKRKGKEIPKEFFEPHWNSIRLEVMADLLIQKFFEPLLRDKLIATGDQELIEGNDHGDKFWGVCKGEGLNRLGQLLMVVRQLYIVIKGNEKYETSLKHRLQAGPLPDALSHKPL